MRSFILTLCLLVGPMALASLQKTCYTTDANTQFCTTDNLGKVQVYIYNAGWCPDCNQEMDAMPAIYNEFTGQNVIFASLSGQDDNSQAPTPQWLQSWRQRHNLPAGFIVAGTFDDFGNPFNPPGYVPFTVILDTKGNVADSGDLSPQNIASEVKTLLGSH